VSVCVWGGGGGSSSMGGCLSVCVGGGGDRAGWVAASLFAWCRWRMQNTETLEVLLCDQCVDI
jgi:hypothetical protein